MMPGYPMVVQRIISFFKKMALKDRSPRKLALSFCVGLYIAFSPFLFLHTVMIFLFSWLFALNLAVTFAVAYGVNNPWTMVFIYSVDYIFGSWFLERLLGVNVLQGNPAWMSVINGPLRSLTGIEGFSFWAFMIGGNLLGILLGVILYPVMNYIFNKLVRVVHGKKSF